MVMEITMHKRLCSILLISICSLFTSPAFSGTRSVPRLVLFISVDQMREEYFERFGDEFTGGLGRIYREGVFFSQAHLNYAASETGPGHATLSTGRYPGHSGITGNEWINPKTGRTVYCVEDSGACPVRGDGGYRSPRNLLVATVGDWLKSSSPASKVISISSKDRAAILMGGKEADVAFWYNGGTGQMVTSSYYADSLPGWVIRFNEKNWIDHHLPAEWEKLYPEERYAADEDDDYSAEFPWNGSARFPHAFTDPTRQILTSPYGDFLTLDFALEAVLQEDLGQRGVPDMLCISLSCTDYVGHSFGPNSQEMHDHLLRIDRRLGEFIAALEEKLGKERIFIALSADHGVMPLPEYLAEHGNTHARRIDFESRIKAPVLALDSTLRKDLQSSQPILSLNGMLNYDAAARNDIDSIAFEQKVRSAMLQIQGIDDVYFRRELVLPPRGERPFIDLFRRSYYSPRGEDFQIRFSEWCIMSWKLYGTTHGSPYEYDTHVPVAFLWSGVRAATVTRNIFTVDIAPTIGSALDLAVPAGIDGKPLTEVAP
jgi:predicted AlkP superfamily pyrophosphatase or phosphodiesterase